MNLSAYLQREMDRRGWTLTEMARESGASRTALRAILNGSTDYPLLETLARLSETFDKPLWELIEMTGIDAGLPGAASEPAARLAAWSMRSPEAAELLAKLGDLSSADLPGVLAYLDAILSRHQRGGNQ